MGTHRRDPLRSVSSAHAARIRLAIPACLGATAIQVRLEGLQNALLKLVVALATGPQAVTEVKGVRDRQNRVWDARIIFVAQGLPQGVLQGSPQGVPQGLPQAPLPIPPPPPTLFPSFSLPPSSRARPPGLPQAPGALNPKPRTRNPKP